MRGAGAEASLCAVLALPMGLVGVWRLLSGDAVGMLALAAAAVLLTAANVAFAWHDAEEGCEE